MTFAWSITCAVLVPVACLGLVLWLEHLEDSLAEALQVLAVGDVQSSPSTEPGPDGLPASQHAEQDPPAPLPDVEHSDPGEVTPDGAAPVTTSPPGAVLQCDDSRDLAASAN